MRRRLMRLAILCIISILLLAPGAPVGQWARAQAASAETTQAGSLESSPDLPLLVNNSNGLPKGYKAKKLVNLYEKKRNFQLANSNIYLEAHVYQAMNEMFAAAKADGVKGFIITSGYRTKKKQTKLYKADKKGVAAKPGFSEHQTGLAFDVTAYGKSDFGETDQFAWLSEHCWDYGFILRYPEDKQDITQIPYEPWHYRFVGVEDAIKMRDSGLCLEEYVAAGGIVLPEQDAQAAVN